jgi:hypothetical protein
MNMHNLFSILSMITLVGMINGAESFEMKRIALYIKDQDMAQRLGNELAGFSKYINEVKSIVIQNIKSSSDEEFSIVIAWDNEQALLFAECKEDEFKKELLALKNKIFEIKTPRVNGPMIFAIIFGNKDAKIRYKSMPIPKEWQEFCLKIGKEKIIIPDDLFKKN